MFGMWNEVHKFLYGMTVLEEKVCEDKNKCWLAELCFRCFDAVQKVWKEIAPMHVRRCYVSTAVLRNKIYAMGGYDGHHRQNTSEKYDHMTNQWSLIAPMNMQRSDASACTLNGNERVLFAEIYRILPSFLYCNFHTYVGHILIQLCQFSYFRQFIQFFMLSFHLSLQIKYI